ncbi:hypothetical protein SCHPADRAFT_603603 [Schizopora paradoxa]|uniref:C3H1-type domain-containing protein n=1 Tax=Schizopora paradoxa TaxID=27342 RepID=A0A0H2RAY8_9AGAM|nr:hypothetical protein SCHPADRAFT_603603 [Schizopora paradoxa]
MTVRCHLILQKDPEDIMSSRNARRHTKPCVYYQKNQCPLSADACDYAHVLVGPDDRDSLKLPQATLRTKPCRFYLGGQCKDGFWCRFKHPATAQIQRTSSSENDNAQLSDDVSASEGEYSDDVDIRDLDPDKKAKPEEHPRYRTRPCRNFLLGKCAYGDHCSYQHISPTHSSASTSGAPMPHTGVIPMSRMSSSSSQNLDESVTPMNDAFSVMALSTGLPAYPSLYPPVPHHAPGQRHSHSSTPPTTPPYSVYAHPHSHHSHSMPMAVGIVHVPVAVPVYQQQPTRQQQDEYHDLTAYSSRTRSSSSSQTTAADRARTSPSRNILFKSTQSKLCKYYSETGKCSKGDNCNYFHDKGGQSVSSSPVRERLERRRSSAASGSSSEGVTDAKKIQAGEPGGYHKVNWRVLGGGVKMGGDPNKPQQKEGARVDEASSHHGLTPTHQVHPVGGTFFPNKSPSPLTLNPQSEQASPSSPTQQDPRRKVATKPAGLNITSPSLSVTSPTSSGGRYQPSEGVDWSDDYDDEVIVANDDSGFPSGLSRPSGSSKKSPAVPTWQTRSSPSSPLHAHSGAPSLFPAESP